METITILCPSCEKKVTLDVDDRNRYEGFCDHCDERIEGSLDDPKPELRFKPGVGRVKDS